MRFVFSIILMSGTLFAQTAAEKELAIGWRMEAETEAHYGLIANPRLVAMVNRVVGNLSREPFTLKLIDDREDVVASALPGGILLITSAAMKVARGEAELAALLAHAMGHVQAAKLIPRENTLKGSIPILFVGGRWGYCKRAGYGDARVQPADRIDLFEADADRFAEQYMLNGGYDPRALKLVFRRALIKPASFR